MSSENQELRKAGLKVTLPRVKILQILENADPQQQHMSAEDVYRALIDSGEDVGLATVYRVLAQFETAGLVVRHNFETGSAVFELDSGAHHDHIVCLDCGAVVEFVDGAIERRQERVASEHGFELADHTLTLYARCTRRGCSRRMSSATKFSSAPLKNGTAMMSSRFNSNATSLRSPKESSSRTVVPRRHESVLAGAAAAAAAAGESRVAVAEEVPGATHSPAR